MLPFLRKTSTLTTWLLVALTDLAVAVPWMLFFYRAVATADWYVAIPGLWLGLLVYGGASLWEAGDRSEAPSGVRRVAPMAIGLVATYVGAYVLLPAHMRTGLLSANPAWAFVPAAAYLWYQGTRVVSEGMEYSYLFERYPYQVGGAALGLVLLSFFGGATDPTTAVLLVWSVILLLAGGLLSLIVTREQRLKAGQASLGERAAGSGRQSRLVSLAVIFLLIMTLTASQILSAERLSAILAAVDSVFGAIFRWIGAVIYLILYRWVMIFGPLAERLANWLRTLAAKAKNQPPPEIADDKPLDELFKDQPVHLFDFDKYMGIMRVLFFVAVIAVVAYALLRMRRRPRRQATTGEEEIIDLGFWSNLWADLKGLLQPRALVAAAAAAVADVLDARSPRMLYRRLQEYGARLGRPRAPQETPNAYRGALGAAAPAGADDVATVTALYNRARYGAAAPEPGQVEVAAAAVARLEAGEKTGQ